MAIEKTDLNPDDDAETRARERDEAARVLAERLRQEEIARIKAETELETTKRLSQSSANNTQQPRQPTEEEWLQAEAETGKTRKQLIAEAQMMNGVVMTATESIRKELAEAKENAKRAEERIKGFESSHAFRSRAEEFYEKNPHLSAFKKEVNEFVSMFPEEDRTDPKKLEGILEKSKVYLRGLAREEKMRNESSGNRGSSRLGRRAEESNETEDQEIDLAGLNKFEKRTVMDIHEEVQSRLADKETSEMLKRYQTEDGLGVRYDESDEFKKGDEIMRRGLRASK